MYDIDPNSSIDTDFSDLKEPTPEEKKKKSRVIAWLLSSILHLLAFLLLGAVIFHNYSPEYPPVKPVAIEKPELLVIEVTPKKIFDKPTLEVTEEKAEEPSLVVKDISVETLVEEIQDEVIVEDDTSINFVETSDSTSPNELDAFFLGSNKTGHRGIFGRSQHNNRKSVSRHYGPVARASLATVDKGLKWLVKHQSPDGRWDVDKYGLMCSDVGPKCEAGTERTGLDGDVSVTAYAVLCFLGAGYDHINGKYSDTVKPALEWLLENQQNDGSFGKRNYEHSIATMALAEAYGMTMDKALKKPTQVAVNYLLSRQATFIEEKFAWDYGNARVSRNDTSVTGWVIMALKAAKISGLNVGDSFDGTRNWIEESWKSANRDWEELDKYDSTIFPYTYDANTKISERDHLSPVGALCAVYVGWTPDDILLASLANDVDKRWFDTGNYKKNSYLLYYASLSQFQIGGKHWDKWTDPENGYVRWLVNTQYDVEGCYDGTWPIEDENFHGHEVGQTLIHCYKLLSLEVAFRYVQLNPPKGE